MHFSLYIARRYLFTKSSNNAINVITGIAITGVVVGAMSLYIVLAGFSGLKEFSLQFSNYFDSDLKITPASGKTLTLTSAQIQKLDSLPGIASYSQIVEERIFMQYKGRNHLGYIKGVDTNYSKVIPTDSILFLGAWFKPGLNEVIVGTGTAVKLSMGINDYSSPLEIYVPRPGEGQITELNIQSAFNRERVVASGMYEVNEDVNSKYVFAEIDLARDILGLKSNLVSAIEIATIPGSDEVLVTEALRSVFPPEKAVIKNRIAQNDALYKMLNTENLAVYLIFTLVLIIALFNVVGSIIMMILDKQKNIRTLYNLGAGVEEIRRIFFLQGVLLTVVGGAVGVLLGILVVWAQLQFNLVYITASLPYPVKLKLADILVVLATISALGIIASKLAASRVNTRMVYRTN